MTKFLMICAVTITTLLGGCATTPNGGGTTPTDIAAIIAQVQGYTKIACGFVPTAATVASIISGGNPAVIAATSIASAICAAVSPTPMASKRFASRKGLVVTPGAVNGVFIEGKHTR